MFIFPMPSSFGQPEYEGHLHYPADMDRTLNEADLTKSYNTVLTIIIVPLMIFPLCHPVYVRRLDSRSLSFTF